jgi:hypothetical protein
VGAVCSSSLRPLPTLDPGTPFITTENDPKAIASNPGPKNSFDQPLNHLNPRIPNVMACAEQEQKHDQYPKKSVDRHSDITIHL